jgi:hypothetical protein
MLFKYTAIIIEPRKHKALEYVLNNVCECLSDEWQIILFHGNKNIDYSNEIMDKLNKLFCNRIKLVDLKIDNLDLFSYSELLTTKSIVYDNIDTDVFLVFQTDSMIFKNNKNLINDFLEYDYVGSPWLKTSYTPTLQCDFIGNGGFSLRNKNKMLEIIEKIEWRKGAYFGKLEDLYFCKNYEDIIVKKPEYSKATTFCVDEVFSEVTFACHKPWVHSHYDLFKTIYPEVEILKILQCVEEEI